MHANDVVLIAVLYLHMDDIRKLFIFSILSHAVSTSVYARYEMGPSGSNKLFHVFTHA